MNLGRYKRELAAAVAFAMLLVLVGVAAPSFHLSRIIADPFATGSCDISTTAFGA